MAGAQLLRRSRARRPELVRHGRPPLCEAAGGPVGDTARLQAAPSTISERLCTAGAVNGDAEMRGTCSAVFYATNGHAALHGVMDMAD